MSINMIEQRLESYSVSSAIEEMQALREISQEIILASLGRAGFFTKAAFHGGTCLRIFHGLNRFSEDLDFTLLEPNQDFVWQEYIAKVVKDMASFGYQMEVTDRHETESSVRMKLNMLISHIYHLLPYKILTLCSQARFMHCYVEIILKDETGMILSGIPLERLQ